MFARSRLLTLVLVLFCGLPIFLSLGIFFFLPDIFAKTGWVDDRLSERYAARALYLSTQLHKIPEDSIPRFILESSEVRRSVGYIHVEKEKDSNKIRHTIERVKVYVIRDGVYLVVMLEDEPFSEVYYRFGPNGQVVRIFRKLLG